MVQDISDIYGIDDYYYGACEETSLFHAIRLSYLFFDWLEYQATH